ncbi:UNVERIFIED_CONTAM: hypothetical protein HDU68_003089 [Siphonaria sp. JEL0065]|nr:hypothetical protein HDU68_003089 [Siphonaria sp. JEL0065]
MDSAAELAVNEINRREDVLGSSIVNILRVQSWVELSGSQAERGSTNLQSVGGSIIPPLQIATSHPDVIAAIGDTADQSTMITASVFSQYKIPMCGGSQNLPALSDKDNYPYFWRVSYSNKWGRDVGVLLKVWKVTRVAIVYDADDIESVGGESA